jgi:hypothetical protein
MKKIPLSNAPSNMMEWVRTVVDILKGHDADIVVLKAANNSISNSLLNGQIALNSARLNALEQKQSTQARVIWSGSTTFTPTPGVATYSIVTFPSGMFSGTPKITVSNNTAYSSNFSQVWVNPTNTNATQVEVGVFRSDTVSTTINIIAVEN